MENILEEMSRESEQLKQLNHQLRFRAQKFKADFIELTLEDFRIIKQKKMEEKGDSMQLKEMILEQVSNIEEREDQLKEKTRKCYGLVGVEDAQKFFVARTAPDFCQKDVQIRSNAIHLYGVDYMNSTMIYLYFGKIKNKIEWLNDSSCNVVFVSEEVMVSTVSKKLLQKEDLTFEGGKVWKELEPYLIEKVERRLFCRRATNKDVKGEHVSGKESKYYQFNLAKMKIKRFIKNAMKNGIEIAERDFVKPHGRKRIQKVKSEKKEKRRRRENRSSFCSSESCSENSDECGREQKHVKKENFEEIKKHQATSLIKKEENDYE